MRLIMNKLDILTYTKETVKELERLRIQDIFAKATEQGSELNTLYEITERYIIIGWKDNLNVSEVASAIYLAAHSAYTETFENDEVKH